MRDVQEEEPEVQIIIDKVGIRGIRRRISTYTPIGTLMYDVKMDIFVSLPPNKRGIHMSRNIESIIETVEEASKKKLPNIETILKEIGLKVLEKHNYADHAEIKAETIYYFDYGGGPEAVDVDITVSTYRNGEVNWCTGIAVEGMTVCPCAQVTYSEYEKTKVDLTPSHSQRSRLKVKVKAKNKIVQLDWLVDAAKNSFSAPTISLLKREDEYKLIKRAFERPVFVEDVVRHALFNIYNKLIVKRFPKDTEIYVECESFESIHPFNVYAFKHVYLSDLIEQFKK